MEELGRSFEDFIGRFARKQGTVELENFDRFDPTIFRACHPDRDGIG
jgi:hypothetical protein